MRPQRRSRGLRGDSWNGFSSESFVLAEMSLRPFVQRNRSIVRPFFSFATSEIMSIEIVSKWVLGVHAIVAQTYSSEL